MKKLIAYTAILLCMAAGSLTGETSPINEVDNQTEINFRGNQVSYLNVAVRATEEIQEISFYYHKAGTWQRLTVFPSGDWYANPELKVEAPGTSPLVMVVILKDNEHGPGSTFTWELELMPESAFHDRNTARDNLVGWVRNQQDLQVLWRDIGRAFEQAFEKGE